MKSRSDIFCGELQSVLWLFGQKSLWNTH